MQGRGQALWGTQAGFLGFFGPQRSIIPSPYLTAITCVSLNSIRNPMLYYLADEHVRHQFFIVIQWCNADPNPIATKIAIKRSHDIRESSNIATLQHTHTHTLLSKKPPHLTLMIYHHVIFLSAPLIFLKIRVN